MDTQKPNPSALPAPQRVGILVGVPALLAEFGVEPDQVLIGLPVGPEVFADPEAMIPFSLASRILESCARRSRCAHFGLLLGARYDHRMLGAPAAQMAQARNLGEALGSFVALQRMNSQGAVAYLHPWGDVVILGYGIYDQRAVARDQIYALVTAIGHNILRRLTQGAVSASEVLFSTEPPRDLKPYAAFFEAPMRFGQLQTGLVLPRSALSAPVYSSAVSGRAEPAHVRNDPAAAGDGTWSERVKHAIRPMLLRGAVTSVTTSAQFGVDPRTLRRRLAREGASFQSLVDEVRFAAAAERLELTDLPIGDIAEALAYAAPGPFISAFRRWSGSTPSAWRHGARAA